jgi:D-3-phosphoglycerate dehydrogenase
MAPLDTPEGVRAETSNADAIVVTANPLTRAHIEALGNRVQIIGRCGIGLDAIDLAAAEKRGIAVLHQPDYATVEVATHAVALILAAYRNLLACNQAARSTWSSWRSIGQLQAIDQATLGVVGYGRIGRAVASRMAPMVGRIVAYDPLTQEASGPVERTESLEDLLAMSDIVTLHLPLTEETQRLLDRAALSRMRRGAILVNVSRGGLVDEDALADALEAGNLAGAALDVLATEPPNQDARILQAPNTLLSPHVAWYSTASERRVRVHTIEGILEYLAGSTPTTGRMAVNPRSALGANRADRQIP